jgi:hypothetical protein
MMNFGPDYVRAIAPYQGGKPIAEVAREFGLDEANIVKLASNENPLGIPESAQRAMQQPSASLARYPDSNGFDLKGAIAQNSMCRPTGLRWVMAATIFSNWRRAHWFSRVRRGVLAVFVCCVSAGDAGCRRARDCGAGERIRA